MNKWQITIIIFLLIFASFLVAIGFWFADIYNTYKKTQPELQNKIIEIDPYLQNLFKSTKYELNTDKNYWLGSADPVITIVEFADFACSNCQNAYSKIRNISQEYRGKIKYVFKDYPLFENSLSLSLAARCAGEQGLFWLMHDKIFQNPNKTSIDDYYNFANQIGADINKYKDCFDNNKYISDIQQNYAEGQELGITGTPTWFINGYKIEGDIPYNIFINIIEGILAIK